MSEISKQLRIDADYLGCNYDDICDNMRAAADEIEAWEKWQRDLLPTMNAVAESVDKVSSAHKELGKILNDG